MMEVLVVVGIIAVLASILIPSLSRVRERGKQVECTNNMRQVAQAILAFAQSNNDKYPRPGVESEPDDWLHWQDGTRYPDDLLKLNKSALVPYLGGRFDSKVFTCPSHIIETHPKAYAGGGPLSVIYPYSYSVNEMICKRAPQPVLTTLQVANSSQKILLIDEASETVNNGAWNVAELENNGRNLLSFRHDRKFKENTPGQDINRVGAGNVAYCDAHVEMVPRGDMYQPIYTAPKIRSTSQSLTVH